MDKSLTDSGFRWSLARENLTDEHLLALSHSRGYSLETCRWLRDNDKIGLLNGRWATPIEDAETGAIVGAHVKSDSGWFVTPVGIRA